METTELKKEVKKRLIDKGWTYGNLATAITDKTGLFCDGSYLSRIFSGNRSAPRIRNAACEILGIKEARHDDR